MRCFLRVDFLGGVFTPGTDAVPLDLERAVSLIYAASLASKIEAIRAPRALHCVQPPYVSGESYGVGDVRCHSLSAASKRAPCLRVCQ